MRGMGWLLVAVAAIAAIFVTQMDTSVSTGFGRVNNIGLMNQQQNYLIICGFLAVVGVLLALFAPSAETQETTVPQDGAPAAVRDPTCDADRRAEMVDLGAIEQDGKFKFASYSYDKLSDAVEYARTHQNERTHGNV